MNIDPCTPCIKKYGPCDINNINNCCYNIVAGYVGSAKYPEIINSQYAKKCQQCIDISTKMNGKTPCYWRNFRKPVIYTQVPHYFPEYYKECGDKQKALVMCKQQCLTSGYPGECIEQCQLEADALILPEKNQQSMYNINTYNQNNDKDNKQYNESNCIIL